MNSDPVFAVTSNVVNFASSSNLSSNLTFTLRARNTSVRKTRLPGQGELRRRRNRDLASERRRRSGRRPLANHRQDRDQREGLSGRRRTHRI